jgi:hypothetical protein
MHGGIPMIASDNELNVTQERIAYFQRLLANLRRTARPEEFTAVAGGYRLEIERMQAEVMNYYIRPLTMTREDGALAH